MTLYFDYNKGVQGKMEIAVDCTEESGGPMSSQCPWVRESYDSMLLLGGCANSEKGKRSLATV